MFLDRIQTMEEIGKLIDEVFGEKKRINLEEF